MLTLVVRRIGRPDFRQITDCRGRKDISRISGAHPFADARDTVASGSD